MADLAFVPEERKAKELRLADIILVDDLGKVEEATHAVAVFRGRILATPSRLRDHASGAAVQYQSVVDRKFGFFLSEQFRRQNKRCAPAPRKVCSRHGSQDGVCGQRSMPGASFGNSAHCWRWLCLATGS